MDRKKAIIIVYDDEGVSFDYEKGKFTRIVLSVYKR
jgi:hypothetical protein